MWTAQQLTNAGASCSHLELMSFAVNSSNRNCCFSFVHCGSRTMAKKSLLKGSTLQASPPPNWMTNHLLTCQPSKSGNNWSRMMHHNKEPQCNPLSIVPHLNLSHFWRHHQPTLTTMTKTISKTGSDEQTLNKRCSKSGHLQGNPIFIASRVCPSSSQEASRDCCCRESNGDHCGNVCSTSCHPSKASIFAR